MSCPSSFLALWTMPGSDPKEVVQQGKRKGAGLGTVAPGAQVAIHAHPSRLVDRDRDRAISAVQCL